MSRLSTRFDTLKSQGKKALIPYIVAGDPDLATSLELMHAMVEKGASVIEIGVPFSDPMAEGPSIQLAHERALVNQTSCRDIFKLVKQFREKDVDTPVLLMGYLNPFEIFGYQAVAESAHESGVDALLIVDLPPEEADELKAALDIYEIDLIFLISPTTTPRRLASIYQQASGFLYYVSLKGVTGAGHIDLNEVKTKIAEIKAVSDLPVNVGFGIKDTDSAAQLSKVADGVIVGSKIVEQCTFQDDQGNADSKRIIKSISTILSDMRSAIDNAQ